MIRKLKNFLHFLNAVAAAVYYRFPGKSMKVIAVTGTSGKTTTTHLIYHVLSYTGKKVSMISTIEAIINGKKYDTGFHVTTPSPWELNKFMRKAVSGGSKYFVMEVSSHSIDQSRVWGANIDISVMTNVAHDHLDYHGTFQNYLETKSRIFEKAQNVVINLDDRSYSFLKKTATGKITTYGLNAKADVNPELIVINSAIIGEFNQYNNLAAAAVGMLLDIPNKQIISSLNHFKGIPGRMEEIKARKPYKVFIDFACKPNALEGALKAARNLTRHKLIVIFGSAGLRDREKRKIMGEIAGNLADYVILTAEDPRTEDVRDIINEISLGCSKKGLVEVCKRQHNINQFKPGKRYFWKIPDRQEAINFAVRNLAKKGDLVLACGKGHEKSMCYGKTEYPWNEKAAVLKALYGTSKTSVKI